MFLRIVTDFQGHCSLDKFCDLCSISVMYHIDIFVRDALDLYTAVDKMVVLGMLILPIHDTS